MKARNLVGTLAGYYLSRFGAVAYGRFARRTQAEVHTFLAERIGVPASSEAVGCARIEGPVVKASRQNEEE